MSAQRHDICHRSNRRGVKDQPIIGAGETTNTNDEGQQMLGAILLIIDCQNDFCDPKTGSLYVPGADEDCKRLQKFIESNMNSIDQIYTTLDTHHRNHIAHAVFWRNHNGQEPEIFQNITHEEVGTVWVPKDPSLLEHCRWYTWMLQNPNKGSYESAMGRSPAQGPDHSMHHYHHNTHGKQPHQITGSGSAKLPLPLNQSAKSIPANTETPEMRAARLEQDRKTPKSVQRFLTIWPEHCLVGTDGHSLYEPVNEAIDAWTKERIDRDVHFIHKGMNCLTEMYSAIKADVPLSSDPQTQDNVQLLEDLRASNVLIICGEASSHCVNCTTIDIIMDWEKFNKEHKEKRKDAKLYILRDCCSPVVGYEKDQEDFYAFAKGFEFVEVTTSEELQRSGVMERIGKAKAESADERLRIDMADSNAKHPQRLGN